MFPIPIYSPDEIKRIEAYKSRSTVVPVPPFHIWLEPTNVCNLRCIHCIQPRMTRKRGFMDFSLFKKIVDEASSYNIVVGLAGQGEPLLHPEFGKMVKYASDRVGTRVLTNGTRLDKEKAIELLDAEPDSMDISFDGPTKEVYEHISRGRGVDYDKTRQNIIEFLDLKRKRGKSKPRCCISIIKQPATEGKIEQFKQWCRTLPLEEGVRVNDLMNWRDESELCQTGSITDKHVKDYLPREKWPICISPWSEMKINWDGSVTGCVMDYNNNYIVGDTKNESMMEIWNGKGLREFREALISKQYERIEQKGPFCSKCNILWWPYFSLYKYDLIKKAEFHLATGLSEIMNKVGASRTMEAPGPFQLSHMKRRGRT